VIDSVEVRVRSLDEIDLVRKNCPQGATALCEISRSRPTNCCQFCGTSAVAQSCVLVAWWKMRFQRWSRSQDSLRGAPSWGVPFKATAGLHHPLRCIHPLTHEPNSPAAAMHGFLTSLPWLLLHGARFALAAQFRAKYSPLALPTESAQTGTLAKRH